ncbi:MAG TPA: carboxymuconolactone decarboxylase family protein [Solirubrobacteraceae bacterium]|nr:carboxymuconolactone decarboxylase family protein [Solirubrobacteraceae bacterium]
MARLPYVDPATAPEPVREAFEVLPAQLNIFRMLAHAETVFRPYLRFGAAILTQLELDAKLRELAILQVARLTPAEYEWVQHVPIAKAVGATDEQIAALERDEPEAECFDADERLVLRFTTQLVRDATADEETFAGMRERFSPREIVELVLAVGAYMMLGRLMQATAIDLDPPAGTAVIDGIDQR